MNAPRSILPHTGIKGFDVVMSNLQKAILKIEHGTLQGLIKAAAHIRIATETNEPLTPVDLGNLRASWFTVASEQVGGVGFRRKGVAADVKKQIGFKREGKSKTIRTGTFKGPRRAELTANHRRTVSEAQSIVQKAFPDIMVMFGYTANYAMHVHEAVNVEFKRKGAGAKWLEYNIKTNMWEIEMIIKRNAEISKFRRHFEK